jgi:hypothetical protein
VRAAIRSLCTQQPTSKEYDFVGLGPHVIDWTVVFGGDEEAHNHGWRFTFWARRFAFSALRDRTPVA